MLWLVHFLAVSVLGVAAKPAELVVEAPWRAPSESLLALETISLYNSSSYFPVLTLLINEELKSEQKLTSTDVFNAAVNAKLLDASLLGLVQTELDLGTQLPVFEGQYQLFESSTTSKYQDCPVVSWIEGTYSCDLTDLYALQASSTPQIPQLFKNDHVIGSGPQWIVVYADLDSPEFQDWHSVLLEMAIADKITYVLRYRPSPSPPNPIQLAGYGGAFHLKRTDYLVVDDRQLDGELDLDVEAPNRVPASKLPYLGFNAAQRIRNASSSESQFALLQNISYNFPQHAVELAKTAFEVESESEKSMLDNAVGMNALFINGKLYNGHDAYDFFDAVHRELTIKNTLDASMPNNTDSSALLTSGIALDKYFDAESVGESKQRCDLRVGASAIAWINDVENDPLFSSLQTDVEEFKEAEGPFVPLRRNMHSLVVVGALDDMQVLMLLKDILQQTGRNLPLQIGIVSEDPVWQRVAQLGLEARQAFLIQKILGSTSAEAEIHAREAYSMASDPKEVPVTDPREWLQRFDLLEAAAGKPIVLANGVPVSLDAMGDWINIFKADFDFLKMSGAFDSDGDDTNFRDTLFSQGLPTRLDLVDPIGEVVFTPWPLTSPIQAFNNPETQESGVPKHSVLFSSSFRTPAAFEIADALLARSAERKDLEVFVRPLSGIDEKFYAAMVDPTFNTFKFSRDLFKAVKLHFFENKSAPQLLTAAREPQVSTDYLPVDTDSLVVDGRYVEIEGVPLTPALLDRIVDREAPRLARITKAVPEIDGIAVAALTAATQGRDILINEKPDITISSSTETGKPSALRITVIVDPASPQGQQLVSLASLAVDAKLDLDVFLSPSELKEMPTRIYRPVLNRHHGGAKFDNLGENVLYTAEIVEPSAWLTTSSKCSYDLDNVLLNMVKETSLKAIYALKGLLVQGFARGPHAPGTALTMRSLNGTKVSETSVMANLGYFQLLAPKPGVYDLYIDGTKSFHSMNQYVNSLNVPVFSMRGVAFNAEIDDRSPEHVKQPGSAAAAADIGKSSWKKLKSLAGLNKDFDDAPASKAAINIFTVASGHLYERFASIMMLSVMKHTKHSVKFWLIENFMSPKFKEFVPELAKKYDFDYEFVSYKWPSWLRAQTEKQRQIWGYKILFLDVLFPQGLHDVIFVDSDQIVRTDFKELLDIDLDGAPYAFTPMGDDREEMEPFRFWKQGFWKKALIDKNFRYHISALFRVDLDRFRKLKTGDVLRQQYQRLSSKAENLANLDQDLPNSLQEVVPIYSLPPEWLWCETWCSDAGLPWAKTIDLCNNPLTKEPKLDRARRQIPEWTDYDDEVSELARSLESRHSPRAAPKPAAQKPAAQKPAAPKPVKPAVKEDRPAEDTLDHDEL